MESFARLVENRCPSSWHCACVWLNGKTAASNKLLCKRTATQTAIDIDIGTSKTRKAIKKHVTKTTDARYIMLM